MTLNEVTVEKKYSRLRSLGSLMHELELVCDLDISPTSLLQCSSSSNSVFQSSRQSVNHSLAISLTNTTKKENDQVNDSGASVVLLPSFSLKASPPPGIISFSRPVPSTNQNKLNLTKTSCVQKLRRFYERFPCYPDLSHADKSLDWHIGTILQCDALADLEEYCNLLDQLPTSNETSNSQSLVVDQQNKHVTEETEVQEYKVDPASIYATLKLIRRHHESTSGCDSVKTSSSTSFCSSANATDVVDLETLSNRSDGSLNRNNYISKKGLDTIYEPLPSPFSTTGLNNSTSKTATNIDQNMKSKNSINAGLISTSTVYANKLEKGSSNRYNLDRYNFQTFTATSNENDICSCSKFQNVCSINLSALQQTNNNYYSNGEGTIRQYVCSNFSRQVCTKCSCLNGSQSLDKFPENYFVSSSSESQRSMKGVSFDRSKRNWEASWLDARTGKRIKKCFSEGRWGSSARNMAINARKEAEDSGAISTRQQQPVSTSNPRSNIDFQTSDVVSHPIPVENISYVSINSPTRATSSSNIQSKQLNYPDDSRVPDHGFVQNQKEKDYHLNDFLNNKTQLSQNNNKVISSFLKQSAANQKHVNANSISSLIEKLLEPLSVSLFSSDQSPQQLSKWMPIRCEVDNSVESCFRKENYIFFTKNSRFTPGDALQFVQDFLKQQTATSFVSKQLEHKQV